MIARRKFLTGLFAAPAIVSIGNIMPVKLVDWSTPAKSELIAARWDYYWTTDQVVPFDWLQGVSLINIREGVRIINIREGVSLVNIREGVRLTSIREGVRLTSIDWPGDVRLTSIDTSSASA